MRSRAHGRLILHHQHRRRAARQFDRRTGACRRGGRADGPRQVELDGRALAGLGVDLHVPAGLLHEAEHHREAQAGALAVRLRGEERLEDAGRDLPVMPWPVSETATSCSRPASPRRGGGRIHGRWSCCRVRWSAARRRAWRPGVQRQVQDRALKLRRIGHRRPQARGLDVADLDVLAQRPPQQRHESGMVAARSMAAGASGALRAKARSCPVKVAPRWAAQAARRCASAAWRRRRLARTNSRFPRMTCRRLLKVVGDAARSTARWPASFWASRSTPSAWGALGMSEMVRTKPPSASGSGGSPSGGRPPAPARRVTDSRGIAAAVPDLVLGLQGGLAGLGRVLGEGAVRGSDLVIALGRSSRTWKHSFQLARRRSGPKTATPWLRLSRVVRRRSARSRCSPRSVGARPPRLVQEARCPEQGHDRERRTCDDQPAHPPGAGIVLSEALVEQPLSSGEHRGEHGLRLPHVVCGRRPCRRCAGPSRTRRRGAPERSEASSSSLCCRMGASPGCAPAGRHCRR